MYQVYFQNQFVGSFFTIQQARSHIERNRLQGAQIIPDQNQRQTEETQEKSFGRFPKNYSVIPRAKRQYHYQRPYAYIPTARPRTLQPVKAQLPVRRRRYIEEENEEI